MRRAEWLATVWCLAAAVTSAASLDGTYRFSRDLPVAQPGWVRVRLPLDLLTHLSSGGDDLFVRDPAGSPLPVFPWREPEEPPPSERVLRVVSMETVAGGWLVTADGGAGQLRHRMLVVDLPGTGLAEGVRLEGSDDGSTWRVLTQGSMFRLNRWGMTSKTYLDYPPAADRYLRLFWPESAGFPAWQSLRVVDWPEGRAQWVEEPVAFKEVAGGLGAGYRLDLPRFPLQGATLALDVDLRYPVQVRLSVAWEGSWNTVAESVLLPDRPAVMGLPAVTFGRPTVISMSAGTFATPSLRGVSLRYRPRFVVFRASEAGRHVLCYGLRARQEAPRPVGTLSPAAEPLLDAEPGAEIAHPVPGVVVQALLAGGAMPEVSFEKRWPVEAPEAKRGELVVLELPEELYGVARRDLGDVRISQLGRQAPYVLWASPDGREVVTEKGTAPRPTGEHGQSALSITLPSSSLPLVALELSTRSALFSRPVRVETVRPPAPEENPLDEHWSVHAAATWRCPGSADVPSRLALPLKGVEGRQFRVTFADGDNAPLPGVDLVVWRRTHAVVFPWPGEGKVELCAGAPHVSAPHYDFAALGDDVILDAQVYARIGVREAPAGGWLRDSPAVRWALLIALAVAALLLVAILARGLRSQPRGDA